MIRLIALFILTLTTTALLGQESDSLRLKVLTSGDTESTFTYGEWNANGGEETHLHYLGSFKTEAGVEFKIMTYTWIWGSSKTSTNRILLYTIDDHYLGSYYVKEWCELPSKLVDGVLQFKYAGCSDVKAGCSSTVDLKKEIPQNIFLECNSMLYSFER